VQVVLLTAHATVQTAVTSMRYGAFDYITKPFTSADLVSVARRAFGEDGAGPVAGAVGTRELLEPPEQARPGKRPGLSRVIGESPAMHSVFNLIEKVAPTHSNVLVYGESGTGKELVARAIHDASLRADRPFIPVDCVSLPDTLLESELFGHEKGRLPAPMSRSPASLKWRPVEPSFSMKSAA
jgi:DNA-binding NtrC family response regulator